MKEQSIKFELNNTGITITLTNEYEGTEYHFELTCSLPISFDYSKQDYVHPSFIIKKTFEQLMLQDGDRDKSCTIKNSYYFSYKFTQGHCELIMLETPEAIVIIFYFKKNIFIFLSKPCLNLV